MLETYRHLDTARDNAKRILISTDKNVSGKSELSNIVKKIDVFCQHSHFVWKHYSICIFFVNWQYKWKRIYKLFVKKYEESFLYNKLLKYKIEILLETRSDNIFDCRLINCIKNIPEIYYFCIYLYIDKNVCASALLLIDTTRIHFVFAICKLDRISIVHFIRFWFIFRLCVVVFFDVCIKGIL